MWRRVDYLFVVLTLMYIYKYLDRFLLICCRGNVFTESLPSNERRLWLRYSCFQASCHNINKTRLKSFQNLFYYFFVHACFIGCATYWWYRSVTVVCRLSIHITHTCSTIRQGMNMWRWMNVVKSSPEISRVELKTSVSNISSVSIFRVIVIPPVPINVHI
jgi:hypothetical protein